MKRRRLLYVALSLSLIFTAMFAGAGSAYAAGTTLYPEVEESMISAKTILNSKTAAPGYSSYSVPPAGDTGVGMIYVVPIKATNTGWMYLDVAAGANNDSYTYVYLTDKYVYNSKTGMISLPDSAKEGVNYKYSLYDAGDSDDNYLKLAVKSGKIYYALIKSADYSEVPAEMRIRAKIYTTGQRTAVASTSKWTVASGINRAGEYGKATWFKVKPTKTGVMTVSLKEYGYNSSYGKVRLYSSSKKALSETVTYSTTYGDKVYFGVKKGKTYYLKVTDCYGSSSENYKFGVRYKITSRTDRSIASKSKAKRIYRKADSSTKTLFVAANSNSVDYYKFTVKKARKTKITLKTNNMTSGYVTMRLYKSNGKRLETLEVPAQYEGYIYTTSKLKKGTYYVKVTKSKMASGSYTVRWTY